VLGVGVGVDVCLTLINVGWHQASVKEVEAAFSSAGTRAGLQFNQVAPDAALRSVVGGDQYFYVYVPGETADKPQLRLVASIPMSGSRHTMQFGREVMCSMLKAADRLNWKRCAVDKEAETQQTKRFQAAFKPFEPNLF